MAMRACIYCKREITYERENRNLLKGGAVGFWQDVQSGQATCPDAPVNSQGQQLHDAGDVHTPPVHDPAELEKFLDGSYIPPVPAKPCGQMYGMDAQGEFLMCGLDEGHDGDCAPGDQTKAQEQAQNQATANSAETPGQPGMVEMKLERQPDANGDEITTISVEMDGLHIGISYDVNKVSPQEVLGLLQQFPVEAHKAIMADAYGIDPSLVQQAQQAEADAAKPEKPKAPDLDDVDDVEKFLRGED